MSVSKYCIDCRHCMSRNVARMPIVNAGSQNRLRTGTAQQYQILLRRKQKLLSTRVLRKCTKPSSCRLSLKTGMAVIAFTTSRDQRWNGCEHDLVSNCKQLISNSTLAQQTKLLGFVICVTVCNSWRKTTAVVYKQTFCGYNNHIS